MEMPLPAAAEAGPMARQAIEEYLSHSRLDEDTTGLIKLGASELVANAVQHANADPEDPLMLIVDDADGAIHIEVLQPSPASDVRLPSADDPPDRFGLRLVDRLADSWGVEEGPPGRVWFEVTRQPPPSSDTGEDGSGYL